VQVVIVVILVEELKDAIFKPCGFSSGFARSFLGAKTVVAAAAFGRIFLAQIAQYELAAAVRRPYILKQSVEALAVGNPSALILLGLFVELAFVGGRRGNLKEPTFFFNDERFVL
jgi:hypothetical protein